MTLKRVWLLALAGLPTSAFAQPITYDAGIVTIPSAQVGADIYVNVTLALYETSPTLRFRLTGATLGTLSSGALATYNATTGQLFLPEVQVGSSKYNAVLQKLNTPDYEFRLASADLIAPGITATVTRSPAVPLNIPLKTSAGDPIGSPVSGTAILDVDADGAFDVILTPSYFTAQPELPVVVLRQTSGVFVNATSAAFPAGAPTTGFVRAPLVADFNGDGRDDYFGADHGQEIASPTGGFIMGTNHLFLSGAPGTMMDASATFGSARAFNHGACKADIDQDGRIDIIVTPLSRPKTYLLRNTASGFVFDQTRLPTELNTFAAALDFSPSSCALADMNGDGWPDLVAAGYGDGVAAGNPGAPYATGVRIFLNDRAGRFGASLTRLPRPAGRDWGSTSVHIADFDGNGRADMLVAYETVDGQHYALQLFLQTAAGVYEDRTISNLGGYETSVGRWRELDVADFNGDGYPDIYLRMWGSADVPLGAGLAARIWLNDKTGRLGPMPARINATSEARPVFLLKARGSGGVLTLFGYEAEYSTNTLTNLLPFTVTLSFGS